MCVRGDEAAHDAASCTLYASSVDILNTHPVSTISVYGLAVRTNNNTEASHRTLNKCVGEAHINIYKLVNIIHEMSVDLKLTCAMVSMHKISRQQKTVFKCNNLI